MIFLFHLLFGSVGLGWVSSLCLSPFPFFSFVFLFILFNLSRSFLTFVIFFLSHLLFGWVGLGFFIVSLLFSVHLVRVFSFSLQFISVVLNFLQFFIDSSTLKLDWVGFLRRVSPLLRSSRSCFFLSFSLYLDPS